MPLAALFEGGVGSTAEQVQEILRSVRRHLAMDVGFVSEFVGDDRIFRFCDGESVSLPIAVGGSDPLEKSFCHYVARGLMPGLLKDAREDPIAAELAVTREMPVGAHLSVPLRHPDGTAYGTLCCFSFSPDRSLTNRDLGVLRLCADVVGTVLQKDWLAASELAARRDLVARIMEAGAVSMLFQPIYSTADARLIAFEALARFESEPVRPPDAWFADAAEVGLGDKLEFLAVEKAVAAFPSLDPNVRLSVNLSPASVLAPGFAEVFAGLPLDRLVLELTEHAAIDSYSALSAALAPLRAGGLRLAVDDVGAGHSTFRHVLDLAPEIIKLDRSLIRGIERDGARRALADALTGYARRIGCDVVAEGVETMAEYAVLRDIGVTRVQGFLTGRPVPLAEAGRMPLYARALAESTAA